jgi:hypothetical protein
MVAWQPHRATMLAMLLATVLISFHVVVHRDVGGWIAKGAPRDTSSLDGHLVEWEWEHMGRITRLLEAQVPSANQVTTQDLYRYGGPYLMALLRFPGTGIYGSAVGATMLAWLVAAFGAFALGRAAAGTGAGVVAATLVAGSPAYIAYLGNVDPHPFGYAGVAGWLALAESSGALAGGDPVLPWKKLVGLGLALCLAGLMMEVAYPLLAIAWVAYGLEGLGARRPRSVIFSLALMTLSFAVSFFGFRWVAEHLLFSEVAAFNEPFAALRGSLDALRGPGAAAWLSERWAVISFKWLAIFPLPVSVLALLGIAVLRRRWQLWCGVTIAIVVVAVALVKPAIRDLYLCFPGIYVLAAAGADWLGVRAADLGGRFGIRPAARWLRIGVPAIAVCVTAVVTNADLWGDYWLPYMWFTVQ